MVGAPPRPGGSYDLATANQRTLPAGLLILPFGVGLGVTLLVALALRDPITLSWILTGSLVGLILVAISVALVLTQKSAANVAHSLSGQVLKPHQEAQGGDPLAHVQAVEQQGRRHRRPCTNCGTMVKASQTECPNCQHAQLYSCKGCRTQVRLDWTNCPECGRMLP